MSAEPPGPAPPSVREQRFAPGTSLRRRAASGTLINGAFLLFVNALALLRGFIVAGFLATTEYGVWGILVIVIATLLLLKQVGIGEKYVQQDDEDQERAFQLAFTFQLIVAVTFAAVGVGFIGLASVLYDVPELVVPGLVLLLVLPLQALHMPLAVFYRRMAFAKQRLLQAIDPIVGFVVAVTLAVAGAGYWSFVIAAVAGAACAAVAALIACPYPLRLRVDRDQARSYFSFSWPIFIGALAMLVTGQGLIAAGTAEVGLAGVGIIVLTSTISQFADRADAAITDTMYPAICAVKDRVDLLYESFVSSNRIALMWAVPFALGVALFAEDILVRLLGPEWEPGVTLLQATAITSAIHNVGFNWQAFYRARGDTKPIAVGGVVAIVTFLAVVMPLLLVGGLDGLAVGVLLGECVYFALRMYYLRKLFPALRVVGHLWRAVAPSLPAVLAVLAVRALDDSPRGAGMAVAEVLLYLCVTGLLTWLLERRLIMEVLSYLRRAPAAGKPAPAA